MELNCTCKKTLHAFIYMFTLQRTTVPFFSTSFHIYVTGSVGQETQMDYGPRNGLWAWVKGEMEDVTQIVPLLVPLFCYCHSNWIELPVFESNTATHSSNCLSFTSESCKCYYIILFSLKNSPSLHSPIKIIATCHQFEFPHRIFDSLQASSWRSQ